MVKYLLSICLLLGACTFKNNNTGWEKEQINGFLLDSLIDLKQVGESSKVIVIPSVGCTGCISNALDYFHKKRRNDEIFIFTNIVDMRMFRQEIEEKLWNDNNIIVDSLSLLENAGLETLYPLLIKHGTDTYIYKKNFDTYLLNL